MQATTLAHRKACLWLAALAGSLALVLAYPALGHAEESNPNNYQCLGSIAPGTPEEGSEEQQVRYTFYCNGPISGFQLGSQLQVTGISSPPTVANNKGVVLAETFSCSGEIPGWAVNCVGAAKQGYESITGQFAIGTKICAEPRVDPLLTVTYAYTEKGAIQQAISGPFDLGRPVGCPPDKYSGSTRLNPRAPVVVVKHKKHKRSKKARRAHSHSARLHSA